MPLLSILSLLVLRPPVNPQQLIEEVCDKNRLPAIGVAIVRLTGEPEIYVTGVRKVGESARVRTTDTWHLGSDTKAFTAALVASLVDQGKGKYDQRVSTLFGIANPDATHVKTTLADLLDMRANLAANPAVSWHLYQAMSGTLASKRQAVAKDVFTSAAEGIRVGEMNYSNTGYVMLGHLAERWTGGPYEDALENAILKPMRITSAGFGPNPTGEPWPHVDGVPVSGAVLDNPAVMNPAGCLHLSLHDWSLWARQVMLSVRGENSLLAASYGERIRQAKDDGAYVNGWMKLRRGWSKGPVLAHSGSNTMNFATAWIAPAEGVAYLTVTNDGGKNAASALDSVVSGLILSHAAGRK